MQRISTYKDMPEYLQPLVKFCPASFLVIDKDLYLLNPAEEKEKIEMLKDPCPKGDEYDLPAKIQYERAWREKKRREHHNLYIEGDELWESVPDGPDQKVDDPENFPLPETVEKSLTSRFTEFEGKSET